jgi:hypothetical protein
VRRHQRQASHPAVEIEQFKADKVLFKDWLRRVKESSTSRNEHSYVDQKPSKATNPSQKRRWHDWKNLFGSLKDHTTLFTEQLHASANGTSDFGLADCTGFLSDQWQGLSQQLLRLTTNTKCSLALAPHPIYT